MAILRVPIELAWNGSGSPGVNVFHLRKDGVPGPGAQNAVNDLHTFYTNAMTVRDGTQSLFWAGMTINLGQVTDVQSQQVEQYDWTEIVVPGPSADAAPALQVCVSWSTSLAAQRGHGRTFLGPCGAAGVASDGTPSGLMLSTVRSAATAFAAQPNLTPGTGWGIYGYDAKGGPGRVIRDIIGSKVRNQFAVLRSRRD